MSTINTIQFLGYASGIGAADSRCCMGPFVIQNSTFMRSFDVENNWIDNLVPDADVSGLDALNSIAQLSDRVAKYTYQFVRDQQFFVLFGGDHTSAIGTWSGVSEAIDNQLGLIWVDAHMDSHTIDTTETHNIHGMPLACLLGHGDPALTQLLSAAPKVLPDRLVLIGTRSYEAAEAALLERLGVKIYFMNEVNDRGIDAVMEEAIAYISRNASGIGISIDIDAIDPLDAPGTGIREPHGIFGDQFAKSLSLLAAHPKFLGMEITEFNPSRDEDKKTEKLIVQCLKQAL